MVPEHKEITLVPMNELNSTGDDFGLTMPLDTTTLFFTSRRYSALGRHSIFTSHRSATGWSAPDLAVEVNNEQSNGMPSITPDGNTMYFSGCDYGLGDCDLYRVDVGPHGALPDTAIPWSVPTNLGIPVNGSFWESQPCISVDGSVLYFSSDRPGGLGGKDLWVCRRKSDGSWDKAVNAGEKINTPFDEVTPWLTPDGKTLLFGSNGHPGLGGFDIFAAVETTGGITVTNLGTPINSSSDEIAFSLSADGTHAFIASNRSGGPGGYDLYRIIPVPIPIDPYMIVRGSVRNDAGRPLMATIEITDLTSDQRLGAFLTDPEKGSYSILLPRGFDYALTAQAPNYLFNSQEVIVTPDLERNGERQVNFSLQPIRGAIRLLLFFEPNGNNLRKESSSDLNRVVSFLSANPEITIEVAGHTDNAGDAEANLLLSQRRAQAVKSYLVGNRIRTERIKVAGYGSSQPIATNDTEEGRAMNRRVEVRVLGPNK
jgi:outer membrane protein OmpA-like peptidoglycan-associated protein/Tol biopolymer transport system component